MPFLASEGCFWPLTAFMRLEVKNDHAHIITQAICNKFMKQTFVLDGWFGCDAHYNNTQSTPYGSNSSTDSKHIKM